jgi:hypothetical protein
MGNTAGIISGLHAQVRLAKDMLVEAALQIRHAQSGLDSADRLLAEIKANLVQIVKQYPPFAHDSPQRIAYLNAITGLRKQLEALSFPPAGVQGGSPELSVQLLGGHSLSPPQAALPQPGDLAIPELSPQAASDGEVASALDAVKSAQDKVAQLKQTMREDVVRFVGGLDGNQAISQAGEVRTFIASSQSQGIGGAAPQFVASVV